MVRGPRLPFWEKVKRGAEADCWPWTGFRKKSGHGLTSYKSAPIHASRKAWILTHGPVPSALSVLHRCDNAACCNPSHMYLGTRADNMIDYWQNTPPEQRGARGRPSVLDDGQLSTLWQMRKKGATLKECAEVFDVHHSTIWRYVTARRKELVRKMQAVRLSAAQK